MSADYSTTLLKAINRRMPSQPPARPNRPLTYELILSDRNNSVGIKCLVCGMVSWNINDVQQKYCGNCHNFHEIMALEQEHKALMERINKSMAKTERYFTIWKAFVFSIAVAGYLSWVSEPYWRNAIYAPVLRSLVSFGYVYALVSYFLYGIWAPHQEKLDKKREEELINGKPGQISKPSGIFNFNERKINFIKVARLYFRKISALYRYRSSRQTGRRV